MKGSFVPVLCVFVIAVAGDVRAEYTKTTSSPLPADAVAVTGPGSFAEAGKTYVLTADVKSPTTPIFLGKDVTLDLNGHTIEYASADYEHVPNRGFEEGLKHWDVSKAPGARILETATVKPFVGKNICLLPRGQEIVSPYITLPVANRSYYAMCGVTQWRRTVLITVEDAQGKAVHSEFRFGSRIRVSAPQRGSTKLGGGFVFAHIHGLPAGKYRIRVKAVDADCQIDEVDIRPALDVGVAVVEKTYPWAYFRCIHDGDFCALFDYNKKGTTSTPIDSVPKVTGAGTVTIRNGIIRSGFEGIRSWGLMCTAGGVKVKLENVKFVASGINTNAVCAYQGDITNCRFEIDTPFIINRHSFTASPVSLRGREASEVQHSEFIGGQGCLNVNGSGSKVHDNLFVNRQTVTNHYSVMIGGRAERVKIYRNRFEPEIGSGITMFGVKHCEVYENTFKITAANGNCEYTNEDYSTNAIRMTDYGAPRGAAKGVFGNRIHHNKFHITGRYYTNYAKCIPIASAIFCSVGGGENFVYENDIVVDHKDPGTRAVACAFYIGGSPVGGEYTHNRITTNVPAFWIGTFYGNASNVLVKGNTITKADGAPADFKPFRLGYGRIRATDVVFDGNKFVNCDFGVQTSRADNTYTRK